jgi:hypothetical protein
MTYVLSACRTGSLPTVRLLLDHGASINTPADYGRTAMQEACAARHIDIARFLFALGASANEKAGLSYGRTALQAAAESAHMHVIKFLFISWSFYSRSHKSMVRPHNLILRPPEALVFYTKPSDTRKSLTSNISFRMSIIQPFLIAH